VECPLCQYPPCKKAGRRLSLLGEGADNYQFGCYACGCARVITKPEVKEAAQAMAQAQRAAVAATFDRSHGAMKKFVFLRSS
jgi:hypothetical protein